MSDSSMVDALGTISGRWEFVEWTIPDFISTMNSCSKKKYFTSPTFSSAGYTWCLRVDPKGNKADGYVSVFLKNMDALDENKKIKAVFGIKKAIGIVSEKHAVISNSFINEWGFSNFIARDKLQEQKSVLVPSGNFTLTCRIEAVEADNKDIRENTTDNQESVSKFVGLEKLSSEFGNLFVNEKKCDITIKVQDKEFHAHRVVLMARSPVFRAMYEHPTSESETGFLNIPDCDPGTFGDFLMYLYSGKLDEVTFETAYSLYSTSHKYDVEELKSFCIDYLKANLDDDNFCDVATFSDQYDEAELYSAAQSLFNENYKSIILTPKWNILIKNNYRIAQKLLTGMATAV